MSSLPDSSDVKKNLTHKLILIIQRFGFYNENLNLEKLAGFSVSQLCRRRLLYLVKKNGMAPHLTHAKTIIKHGHVSVNNTIVTNPELLLTLDQENQLSWAIGSKYRTIISRFANKFDDFEE